MLTNISTIDGRYYEYTKKLVPFFSEFALFKYRLKVEIEYLISICSERKIFAKNPISLEKQKKLRSLYENFSSEDAKKIKKYEDKTKHDVKSLEYFIRDILVSFKMDDLIPFIHFALTSEDINNIAYTLSWKDSLNEIFVPKVKIFLKQIDRLAGKYKDAPMLSMTHGQPAVTTTFGKEILVYSQRLKKQLKKISVHTFDAKLNGAVGTFTGHHIAYPEVDWIGFSKKFIKKLELNPNLITTQVEPYDNLVESYQNIIRINNILTDFAQDMWFYISRKILKLKRKDSEVGSSTMPHKINPITFENAEGNLKLSNMYLSELSKILPISRMQRDLSGSTCIRNQGVAMAYSIISLEKILEGIDVMDIDEDVMSSELEEHWEILTEAIQIILRKNGNQNAYEGIKDIVRGNKMNKLSYQKIISELTLPSNDKAKLMHLTPKTYTGLINDLFKKPTSQFQRKS